MKLLVAVGSLLAGACCTSLPRLPAKQVPLPPIEPKYSGVVVSRDVWHDERRGRDVPVTIYAPEGAERLPVVVFSHGIGEDRDSYSYFGERLARHGFVAVHPTHAGTDRAVLERGYLHLYRAVQQPVNWINRPLDVSFVLDRMASDPRADSGRAAIAGHSAGAFTAFASAGLRTPDGHASIDPRVRAIVPMSMPRIDGISKAEAYTDVTMPVLNITGTCDTSLIYRTFPRHRRIAFDSSRSPHHYLVTLERVNHDTFVLDDPRRDAVADIAIAFLRAWISGEEELRLWFEDPGRGEVDGTAVTVERAAAR